MERDLDVCVKARPSSIVQADIYHDLAEEGDASRFLTTELANLLKHTSPRNTRDFRRSEVNKHVVKEGWDDFLEQTAKHQDSRHPPYVINWLILQLQYWLALVAANPFRAYVQEVDPIARKHLHLAFQSLSSKSKITEGL